MASQPEDDTTSNMEIDAVTDSSDSNSDASESSNDTHGDSHSEENVLFCYTALNGKLSSS